MSDLTMPRDLHDERLRFLRAAITTQIDATDLAQLRERRAEPGPVRLLGTTGNPRDLSTEALEEIADLTSYLIWWAQTLQAAGRADQRAEVAFDAIHVSLEHALLAWDALDHARAALKDIGSPA